MRKRKTKAPKSSPAVEKKASLVRRGGDSESAGYNGRKAKGVGLNLVLRPKPQRRTDEAKDLAQQETRDCATNIGGNEPGYYLVIGGGTDLGESTPKQTTHALSAQGNDLGWNLLWKGKDLVEAGPLAGRTGLNAGATRRWSEMTAFKDVLSRKNKKRRLRLFCGFKIHPRKRNVS